MFCKDKSYQNFDDWLILWTDIVEIYTRDDFLADDIEVANARKIKKLKYLEQIPNGI